jgi:1-deoxy-D-xylulose-5-phosphate synthase
MLVMTPSDENECRQMLYTAFRFDGPAAVRYPRGTGPGTAIEQEMRALPVGKGEIRRSGAKVAMLAFGTMLAPTLLAAADLDATVANMRFVKPLDRETIRAAAGSHELLVTIEENAVIGGAGSEVARAIEEMGLAVRLLRIGLPDRFIDHGDQQQLLAKLSMDSAGIVARVKATIGG